MENSDQFIGKVLQLFIRFGIRSLTMDDISRELGISKKTLYEHVEDKATLVRKIIDLDLSLRAGSISGLEHSGGNAIDDLIAINERLQELQRNVSPSFYFDLRKYYPDEYLRWTGEKQLQLQRLISDNIRKGKQSGIYRSTLNGETIARIYIYLFTGMDTSSQADDMVQLTPDFLRELLVYHLHGICNQNGLEYLNKLKSNWDA